MEKGHNLQSPTLELIQERLVCADGYLDATLPLTAAADYRLIPDTLQNTTNV